MTEDKMKTCPQCQFQVIHEARFCPHCGLDLAASGKDITRSMERIITIGSVLGHRFEILEEIAKGGMGIILKANDVALDEIVALKVLKTELAEDEEMIARFKREIKVARKIKHSNVCSIYDFWNTDKLYYISMEYIEGQELSELIEAEQIPPASLIPIIRSLIMALGAAHRENIIHRDLKPSNIMIDHQFRPIVMDFGIARYIGKADLTQVETILGTPTYMSPEQFKGLTIDQRSDIYSFGVILYQLYTGQVPFSGETPIEVAMKHLQEMPVPPHEVKKDIPKEIEAIIMKCLQKDATERYQTVHEILNDLFKESTEKPRQPRKKKKVKTVLIVDDDEDIRQLLATILKRNNYETIMAGDGEEAVTRAIEEIPDLILMDIMMPRMDGYHAAEFLRDNQLTTHIPIIIITSKDDQEYKAYGKTIGIKEYITKPLDINYFIEKVKKIVPP